MPKQSKKIKRKKYSAGFSVTSAKSPSLTDTVIGITKTK